MPNKQTRVMDVIHPHKVAPSTTSRPVIVTNRPVLAEDPMLTSRSDIADEALEIAKKDSDGQVTTERHEKVIAIPGVPSVSTEEKPGPVDSMSTKDDTSEDTVAKDGDTKPTDKEYSIEAQEKVVSDGMSLTDESSGNGTGQFDDDDAKRAAEFERLAAEGNYKLPIGQHKHAKNNRAIMSALLVTLLLAVLCNTLLDAGVIHLSGIPHTNFLQ